MNYFTKVEEANAKLVMGKESMGRKIKETVLTLNGKTVYPKRHNMFKIMEKGNIYRKPELLLGLREGRYLMFDSNYKTIGIVEKSDLLPEFEIKSIIEY